nr:hypothetical protein CFP56_57030 [Quercus suber]
MPERPWQMLHSVRRGSHYLTRVSPGKVVGKWSRHLNISTSVAWQGERSAWKSSWQHRANKRRMLHDGQVVGHGQDDGLAIMGIVSASSPGQTTTQQLLDSIPASASLSSAFGKGIVVTLLLTPSFAHSALNPDLPLHLMRRVQDDKVQHPLQQVAYTAAVVDRLPSRLSPTGVEGLAYMLRPLSAYKGVRTKNTDPYDPKAQNPGTVGFFLNDSSHDNAISVHLELPLAHTIFSTGHVSTMVTGSFELARGNVLHERHEGQQLHKRTSIPLPFPIARSGYKISAPLLPLTPFRTIGNSMGNIVRTVSTVLSGDKAENDQRTQPASQELEASVSAYFKACDLAPAAVNVWALIIPSRQALQDTEDGMQLRQLNMDRIKEIWTSKFGLKNAISNNVLKDLIYRGSRMHRVLSGGGGWGKKAGLLSLDPDTKYNARTIRNDVGWDFDFTTDGDDSFTEQDMQKQQKQALGTIVKEGEEIMFFIAPGQVAENGAEENVQRVSKPVGDMVLRTSFGVIASTVDHVPDQSCSSSNTNGGGTVHTPGLFGALSEGGMALEVRTGNAYSSRTKFDIPGAIFEAEFSHVTGYGTNQNGKSDFQVAVGRSTQQHSLREVEHMSRKVDSNDIDLYESSKQEHDTSQIFAPHEDSDIDRLRRQKPVEIQSAHLAGDDHEPEMEQSELVSNNLKAKKSKTQFSIRTYISKDHEPRAGPPSPISNKSAHSTKGAFAHINQEQRPHPVQEDIVRKHLAQYALVRKYADDEFAKSSSGIGKFKYGVNTIVPSATRSAGAPMTETNAVSDGRRADSPRSSNAIKTDDLDLDLDLDLLVGQVVGEKQALRKVISFKNRIGVPTSEEPYHLLDSKAKKHARLFAKRSRSFLIDRRIGNVKSRRRRAGQQASESPADQAAPIRISTEVTNPIKSDGRRTAITSRTAIGKPRSQPNRIGNVANSRYGMDGRLLVPKSRNNTEPIDRDGARLQAAKHAGAEPIHKTYSKHIKLLAHDVQATKQAGGSWRPTSFKTVPVSKEKHGGGCDSDLNARPNGADAQWKSSQSSNHRVVDNQRSSNAKLQRIREMIDLAKSRSVDVGEMIARVSFLTAKEKAYALNLARIAELHPEQNDTEQVSVGHFAQARAVIQMPLYLPIRHVAESRAYWGQKEKEMRSEETVRSENLDDGELAPSADADITNSGWQLLQDMASEPAESRSAAELPRSRNLYGWNSAQLQNDVLAFVQSARDLSPANVSKVGRTADKSCPVGKHKGKRP